MPFTDRNMSSLATLSWTSPLLPKRSITSRRASCSDTPRRIPSSTAISICDCNSARISASSFFRCCKLRIRRSRLISHLRHNAELSEFLLQAVRSSLPPPATVFVQRVSACNTLPCDSSLLCPTRKQSSRFVPSGGEPDRLSPPPLRAIRQRLVVYAEQSRNRGVWPSGRGS